MPIMFFNSFLFVYLNCERQHGSQKVNEVAGCENPEEV
jgi:hypothetical protein